MQNAIIERKKTRIQSFDIARTFAILCVVLCHSVELAYSNINYIKLSDISQIFRIIFFTVGRLGVPIFLFLTGALTLKKQIENDEDVNKFYKKNLLPLFITVEIWNILYNVFLVAIINQKFCIEDFLKNIFFFKRVNISNAWYMPMILGMYIAIPFIAKIVKTFTLKTIKIPMLLVFITSILLPSVNKLLNILNIEEYNTILEFSFLGGVYGLYILLGYYISEGVLKKYSNTFLAIIAINSFIITCIFQYITYDMNMGYNVWYDFITLFTCAICIFELFVRIKNRMNENILIKLTKYISQISLGIFFMHEIFLNLLMKHSQNLNEPSESIILFILSMMFSIIFIYITSKVKFIKEKAFLIKD